MTNRIAASIFLSIAVLANTSKSETYVPFTTRHRYVTPNTEVTTNVYGSITGVVDRAYVNSLVELTSYATKDELDNHVFDKNNPHAVTAAQVGALPLVEDYNGQKTAVTIGSRARGQPVGMYSLANGIITIASGDYSHAEGSGTTAAGFYSHAEGCYTIASGDYSHAEGYGTTAAGSSSHAEGYDTTASGDHSHAAGYMAQTRRGDDYSFAWNGDSELGRQYASHGPGTFNINPAGGLGGFWIGEQTLFSILTNKADKSDISAENQTFSNAVLAVGLNIDTNSVAVLNDIAATFGGFPIEGTATTVGGLLAALAAAVAWLKRNKVQTLKLEDNSVETSADGGVAKLDDFFTESNSLLTGTIDAEVISKGTAPDAHLEAPTDERLKLVLADNSVAYDSAKALPYKLTSAIGDRVVATMTLTAASTDITLPTISANDTTVKDFILDVTNAYAVEGVATDAGINIPRTDFKLVTRDGESLTDVTTVKAGKSAFICFTQKSPVVVDGTTYPCWCVIQLPFGDPS